ncbi:helix-turn-helix transcriptional regulator [Streptomyces sp. AC550_RSS872]|uniref:helix-turn-helix transcriptional regulator n=1 Tax=Streptomyces sp. AC550_RSS872 TaxID=2823689 RepID=UPI001C26F335|nr:helix-turn-helix transcriptional regulator [Streptomyces sp. AC550_RSS872]
MSATDHPEHGTESLCPAGTRLYERALRGGRIRTEDAAPAPCLVSLGLLHPTLEDMDCLEPVAPPVALHRLLKESEERIAEERRREEQLAETFAALMRIEGRHTASQDSPAIRVLSGMERINQVITEAMADATQESLCIQPNTAYRRKETAQVIAMGRDQALLDRGGRIRTLYHHTQRHAPVIIDRYEQLRGDAEARSLDEITDRLIIVDRAVAFIPANSDRTMALEIRQPALVSHLATTFDRLWRHATPMYPQTAQKPSVNGITPRQRAIAGLLIEGHTDAVIANRLGLNVRTARVHIAKLAATLGSESRAQLGYLIGQSGILKQEGATE